MDNNWLQYAPASNKLKQTYVRGFMDISGNVIIRGSGGLKITGGNVVGITKEMVGLGNADNTSDTNKPISTAQQTALDLKAPLASPTFTGTVTVPATSITNTNTSTSTTTGALLVAGGVGIGGEVNIGGNTRISGGLVVDGSLNVTGAIVRTDIQSKVYISEQVDISNSGTGPGLIVRQFGTQDIAAFYDDASQIFTIKDGGDVSMNHNLYVGGIESITNTTISTSTTTGALRVVGGAGIGGNLYVGGTTVGITKSMVGLGNVDDTSDASKPISTAQQTALDLKAPIASPTFTGTVSGITKTMVGLGNVDNTSDANKPVSTAQQTALDLKATIASPTFTGTVTVPTTVITNTTDSSSTTTGALQVAGGAGIGGNLYVGGTTVGITKTMVGLGNVDNTADTAKPVSTAQQTALDLKANLASPTFTGTVSGITKTMVGLGNVDNTTDANKPVSTAQQTALDLKANLASPTFTGTVSASSTNTSTSTSTGALVVTGGAGIGGNVNIGGISNLKMPLIAYNYALAISTTYIFKSLDGINWTTTSNTLSGIPNIIKWNGSYWVSGKNGGNDTIFTSYDGLNWTGRGNLVGSDCQNLAWSPTLSCWLAVGTNAGAPVVGRSSDGINWTALTGHGFSNTLSYYMSVVWSSKYNRFVVCGNTGTNSIIAFYDGTSWSSSAKSLDIKLMETNESVIVGVGGISGYYGDCCDIYYSSDGGVNWNYITWNGTPAFGGFRIYGIAWNGSVWVATGYGNGWSSTVNPACAATSTDGITWTASSTQTENLGQVTWNGKYFVAVNKQDISRYPSYSTDGVTWTNVTSGSSLFIGAIGVNTTTTSSINASTGALVVSGGVGIGENMNVGGTMSVKGQNISFNTSTGALVVSGGAGIGGNLYVGGTTVGITKSMVGLGNVDNTADTAKPVSTAQQTALDLKANLASPTFTGTVGGITKSMVGLANVDNTADTAKPVSTAQQTALDLKANLASPTFTGTVSGITKSMVGLGNVDNTADASKPVSTAQQTALDLKANLASPTFTGTVGGITKSMVGLGSVDDTADTAKPVSTAQQTALDLKANLASPTFTGTVSGITKSMVGLGSVDDTADTAKPVSTAQQTALDLKANLASPTFTGTVTVPATSITSTTNSTSTVSGALQVTGGVGIGGNLYVGGNTRIYGGLTVDGSFNVIGSIISETIQETIRISERVDISNSGTGPGLTVRQHGTAAIAEFFDDTISIMQIKDGGDVSMNNQLFVGGIASIKNTTVATSTASGALQVVGGAGIGGNLYVGGTTVGITKTMVGLSNVDNTADTAKPVSTAQQTALDLKANLASPTFTGTVSGITKSMVGLGSVDNTADTAKPVSTAQQTALDLKANLASPTFTGTVGGITKSMVGLGSVDNTADAAKPVSTAQQTALDLKANLASPTFTGTVGGITKSMVGLGSVDNTADTAKPVSTAQQTALDLKANLASPTFTGTVGGITKSMVGLSNVDNTADTAKPVSTAQQTALDLKANLASPTFTGTLTTPETLITNSTASASTTTGALVVSGGAGIGGNAFIGGNVNVGGNIFLNTGNSIYVNGVVLSTGGGGGGGTSGNVVATSTTVSTSTTTGALVVSGGAGIVGDVNVGGIIETFSSAAATSTATGALQVIGGAGIGGTVYAGGINTGSLTILSPDFALWYAVRGGTFTQGSNGRALVHDNITGWNPTAPNATKANSQLVINYQTDYGSGTRVDSDLIINSSTASTSTVSGAVRVGGGVGIGGNVYVGGNIIMTSVNNNSTRFGYLALTSGTGSNNTAFGASALNANNSANNNTAVGASALTLNTGSDNTAVGKSAGSSISTGTDNTVIGSNAGFNITSSTSNIAIGREALTNNTNIRTGGNNNVLIGNYSGRNLNSSSGNVGVGSLAIGGFDLTLSTTGIQNTAIGYAALQKVTTASNNVCVGYTALSNITTGGDNVAIGVNAGQNQTTGSSNTFIGRGADGLNGITNSTAIGQFAYASASNQIVLGTASQNVSIPGTFTSNVASVNAASGGGPCINMIGTNTGGLYMTLYPEGGAGGRKGWIGYASTGVQDIAMTNEYGSGSIYLNCPGAVFVGGSGIKITSSVVSNSTATGALQVIGGAGIGGNVFAGGRMNAVTFNSTSDSRIKNNIISINSKFAVDKLRQLEPCAYGLIEEPTERTYGFIAQEISKVLPEAVSLTTNCVPSIYEFAFVEGTKITLVNKTIDLSWKRIKISDKVLEIVQVLDDKTFYVSSDIDLIPVDIECRPLVENLGTYKYKENDEIYTGIVKSGAFIYGHEIDDFHMLDKDVIWAVTSAATKELDRELQEAKQTIRDQDARILNLEEQIALIKQHLNM